MASHGGVATNPFFTTAAAALRRRACSRIGSKCEAIPSLSRLTSTLSLELPDIFSEGRAFRLRRELRRDTLRGRVHR